MKLEIKTGLVYIRSDPFKKNHDIQSIKLGKTWCWTLIYLWQTDKGKNVKQTPFLLLNNQQNF